MKRLVPLILLNLILAAIIPFALVTEVRMSRGDQTRLHPIQDMDNQPRFKSQQVNAIFADNRAMRPQVPGTIRYNEPTDTDPLMTGREDGEYIDYFPIEITDSVIKRGQERYNIYCATCHGYDGVGNGMINQRAEQLAEGTWTPPTSYHTQQIRERPNGHLYNTIKNGIRSMSPYGSQISVEDRWAIVAYVRALQRSQNAALEDVPEDQKDVLERQN
jgi:mono/diheme cytochrome c family protein